MNTSIDKSYKVLQTLFIQRSLTLIHGSLNKGIIKQTYQCPER